ncbi:phage antirepressor N-terminal domain-containing protein [Acinetobacter sp. NIPH 1958]|uniref:phage antirepressor N-terminal domain-containing protein n=1 Tax=Acinetobacter sp. NIPH 1958 TaxID=2923430 RepID=UPI001F4A2A7D|nr:phage antirepressor N-terminal domain-containing protein [Acinetobacter sp. NIPH 1958]MCH7357268.1 phage antirepressor N-terminal domain-containing protein [Acinetobacter sp. NIPH 1958]
MTTNSLTQITVPFHSAELYLVEHNGQPYTPMKPIVEGMGLDWAAQFNKLKQKFASTIAEITMVANDGKERLMMCLPVRKLPAWLYSVNPNKVSAEIRENVIVYQNECDDVLWDYWTKGVAVNPRSTKDDRVPLKNAVNMLVGKAKFLNYSDAYALVHHRFNIKHLDELTVDQLPNAIEYVHHLIGEYIPKVEYIDPELKAFELLAADTTNRIHDWIWSLQDEIKRLKGNIPNFPVFDKEAITRAVVSRMTSMSRMLLTIDSLTNKPNIQFIPNNSWILNDENIAKIVGDREGPNKEILPDIIQAAANRLRK